MVKKDLTKTGILETILDIAAQIFVYIYEFIFVWEDEPYEGENFIENEKLKHSLSQSGSTLPKAAPAENNATVSIQSKNTAVNRQDFESLKKAFGTQTADYIFRLREEVDVLVEKHSLVRENTMMIVIPPEKMKESLLGPSFFENTLERLYSQYEKDVILKPGNIKLVETKAGTFYAEVHVETYTVTEELLASV